MAGVLDVPAPTLDEQIHCVEREVLMRQRNYPNWILQSRMKQENGDIEIARMKAVADSLRRLKAMEPRV